jgi:bromodomain-containing protein 3
MLWNHKYGWPFQTPVDYVGLNIPDYPEKIKHPMDLGTIKQKIEANEYVDVEDFASDVRLTFDNCCTYNQAGSDIHTMGLALLGIFEKQYKKLRKEPKVRPDDSIETMKSIIVDLKNEHSKLMAELQRLLGQDGGNGTNGKTKDKKLKKEAKQVEVKVEADTFSVKQKQLLGAKINKLGPEDLHPIVQIIDTDIPESAKQSGEVEIDLEILSVPTLKKLDAYVDACLKRNGIVLDSKETGKETMSASDSESSSDSDSSDSESEREGEKQQPDPAATTKPNDAST